MDNNQFQRPMPGPPMPNLDQQRWVAPRFDDTPNQAHPEAAAAQSEPRQRAPRGRPRQSRPGAPPNRGGAAASGPGGPPVPHNGQQAANGGPPGASPRPAGPPRGTPPGSAPRAPRPQRAPPQPQPPQPPRQPRHAASVPKQKRGWRSLLFKMFLAYSAFLLIFSCPLSSPVTPDMPCLCQKLHNRIEDFRPLYTSYVAPYVEPPLHHPLVQKTTRVVLPAAQRAVDASSELYNSRVRPHIASAASSLRAVAEKQARPHYAKLEPYIALASAKLDQLKASYWQPAYTSGVAVYTKYGQPAFERTEAFVQSRVRPHVSHVAALTSHHGQIYWAVFRKWFHENVAVKTCQFYTQTVLPSLHKIRDRLKLHSERVTQDVEEPLAEPFGQESTVEPSEPTVLVAEETTDSIVLDEIETPQPAASQPVETGASTTVESFVPPIEVHIPETVPEVPEVAVETPEIAQVESALDSAPEPPTKDDPAEAIEEYLEEAEEAEEAEEGAGLVKEAEPVIEFNQPIEEVRSAEVDIEEAAEPVPEPPVEPVESEPEAVEPEAAEPEAESVAEPEAESVAEPEAESVAEPLAESEPEAAESIPEPVAKPDAKAKAKLSWIERVDRTAMSAVRNLQTDVNKACEKVLADAKPGFVGILRNLARYGEERVTDLTTVVENVEKDAAEFDDDSVVHDFTAAAEYINSLSTDVRNEALSVAEKALEHTEALRKRTLEAMDDFFDVILLEAGRQGVDDEEDEFAKWKEYHELKEHLNEVRSDIETLDIDMELVNTSLKEPQQAAILMAQEFINHLNSLRAKTQFLVQQQLMQKRAAAESLAEEVAAEASKVLEEARAEAQRAVDLGEQVTPEAESEAAAEPTPEAESETAAAVAEPTPEPVSQEEPEASASDEVEVEAEAEAVPPIVPEAAVEEVDATAEPELDPGAETVAETEPEITEPEAETEAETTSVPTTAEPEAEATPETEAIPEPAETTAEPAETEETETPAQASATPVHSFEELVESLASEIADEPIETLWEAKVPPFQYVGEDADQTVSILPVEASTPPAIDRVSILPIDIEHAVHTEVPEPEETETVFETQFVTQVYKEEL